MTEENLIPTVEEIAASGAITGDPEAGDPFVSLGADMAPLPEGTDRSVIVAAMDLLNRVGAHDFVVGYDDSLPPERWWMAACEARGESHLVSNRHSPEDAATRLLRRLVNGSKCASCNRATTLWTLDQVGPQDRAAMRNFCVWVRDHNRWERGCATTHEEFAATMSSLEDPRG